MSIELAREVNGQAIGFGTGARGVEADRPTLILIHGGGGSRDSWHFQAEGLDDEFNIVALEMPGHGQTGGRSKSSISQYTDWTAQVLQTWNLPKRPVLGGHSMGGAIAIELGLTRPELLSGLVLVGTGAWLGVNLALLDGFKKDFHGTVRLICKWAFAKTADPELIEEGYERMARNAPEVLVDDFQACADFNRRDDVDRLTLPSLIVCGTLDKMTPPEMSELLKEKITGSRLEFIDQAGHQVAAEQPQRLNQVIGEFIRGLNL